MNLSASQRVPPIDGADVLAQLRSRRSGFGLPGQFYRSAQVHGYDLNLIFYREWLFAAHTAPSHAKKLAHMRGWLRPYPWGVGRVLRYRDHDYYLLGAAIDGYLKSIRGPEADVWEMLVAEVFEPHWYPCGSHDKNSRARWHTRAGVVQCRLFPYIG
jgi:hypothetical protein